MEICLLTVADWLHVERLYAQTIQLLPFFSTRSEAKRQLVLSFQEQEECWGFFEARELVGIASLQVTDQRLLVHNFLWLNRSDNPLNSLKKWQQQLEKLAKIKRVSGIDFRLLPGNLAVNQLLENQGMIISESENHYVYSLEIHYRTAFVLAGGGARGAYQIGAWQALEEVGISAEIICGTSVGALNGALIRQGNLQTAKKMWEEIDTGKILAYPNQQVEQAVSLPGLLKEIQNFATSAFSTLGVSTKPLQKLISDLLDEESLFEKSTDFYLVTTQLPTLKETVISIKETDEIDFPKWLLASSSFFPAMQATKIKDNYYVDGGYRNNIPVDVALAAGATEIIVIDVKGPGVTKMVKVPDEIPALTIASPWTLGNVLLFDGNRSQWNIQLGYLETLKAFGKYQGYWYSFEREKLNRDRRHLNERLLSSIQKSAWLQTKILSKEKQFSDDILKKIRRVYKEPVETQTMGQVVLELCAKLLEVAPIHSYTIPSLERAVLDQVDLLMSENIDFHEERLLSITEWGKKYIDHASLLTEFQQVAFLYKALRNQSPLSDYTLLNLLRDNAPISCIMALLLISITE